MKRISLCHSAVPKHAEKQLIEVFRSGQYSPGKNVKEFEEKFAGIHKAQHAIFVNSGTDALRLSLLALKEKHRWPDGAGVVVPALTFVATVNVIMQAGLKPVFVDVDRLGWMMNEGKFRDLTVRGSRMGEPLVAVMPVHLFGQAVHREIYEIARVGGLKVLEDSCETILNPLKGDASCHSTYMAHHITTGVGGVALTNDMELNLLIRSYANHGRNASYLPGYFMPKLGENLLRSRFRFDRVGYSCRATEFEAVLGLSQMDGIKENVRRRRELARWLFEALWDHWQKFDVKNPDLDPDHTFMMYPVVAKDTGRTFDKYKFCLHLEKHGIETRDMMPITSQPCYKRIINPDHFPWADWINKNGFYIPCHPGMTKRDVKTIAEVFRVGLTKQ